MIGRNPVMLKSDSFNKFKEIVGKDNLLTEKEDLLTYAYDGTQMLRQLPEAILIPHTTEEISQIMKYCNQEKIPVVPRGSGTGLSGGSIPVEGAIVLLLNQLDKILEIDSENMTAWVETGVITSSIHQAVEKIGLFYPPDPGSMGISTIGGNVAENSGGLRGLKYGVTRNYVLGMEVVLPNGDIIHTGNKCAKDVAGFSIKDVFIGSEGTLGIITKVLLKLIPKPEAKKTILAYFKEMDSAAKTVSAIIAAHIIPTTLEFLDHITIECVENYSHIGLPLDMGAILLIEVDGAVPVVEKEAQQITEICQQHSAAEFHLAKDNEESLRFAAARRNAFPALARFKPTTILEDATVPRSAIAPMLAEIHRIAEKYNLMIGTFGHAGDGNLHPTCLTDERDKDEIERAEKAFNEIFEKAVALGGTITGEHGVGLSKKAFLPKQLGDPGIAFMQSMKDVLDPNHILNPGKVFSLHPRCEGLLPQSREQIPDTPEKK
jgi:glycolate oxidase